MLMFKDLNKPQEKKYKNVTNQSVFKVCRDGVKPMLNVKETDTTNVSF